MAVQAQYPSNIPVADFCLRARQVYANGSKNPFPYLSPFEDLQFQLMNTPGVANQVAQMNSIAGTTPVQQSAAQFTDDFVCGINGSNKRPRQSEFLPVHQHQHLQQPQPQHQHIVHDFHRTPVSLPVSGAPVSTGLRLAFPDDRLSSSTPSGSGKLELNSSGMSLLAGEIAMELQRQREEMEQLMRVQEEQMRRAVEEKQQHQSRALLATVERYVAKRLREKDIEMEKVARKNMELEERLKQLTLEARMWQKQAKNNEIMVASLRSDLQQAVAVQSREQSREGVGDNDADDAESCHRDNAADDHARIYRENLELKEKRSCRVCRSSDVCILLLPCRHLCLCKECEARLDTCPLCRQSKKASVQVYMS